MVGSILVLYSLSSQQPILLIKSLLQGIQKVFEINQRVWINSTTNIMFCYIIPLNIVDIFNVQFQVPPIFPKKYLPTEFTIDVYVGRMCFNIVAIQKGLREKL